MLKFLLFIISANSGEVLYQQMMETLYNAQTLSYTSEAIKYKKEKEENKRICIKLY